MKRPFLLLGFSALAALALAALLGPGLSPLPAALCAAAGLCALFFSRLFKRKLSDLTVPGAFSVFRFLFGAGLALLTAALCLFRYSAAVQRKMLPAQALCGQELEIRGTVLDYPTERDGKSQYQLRVERVLEDGKALEAPVFIARLSAYDPLPCRPCDTVDCKAKLYPFSDSGGLYSQRNGFWADGIAVGGYLTDSTVIPSVDAPPRKLFAELRHLVGRSFEKRLPGDEAGLLRALLLGEKEQVADSTYAAFRTIGVSHLLVVSGLHLSAFAAFFSLVLKKLCRSRPAGNLLAALGILFFLGLVGFPVSAVRSGVMLLLYLLADSLGKRADSLNSLGLALFLLCLLNPFSGGDLSLALSAFSTLGILLWAAPFSQKLLRPFRERPWLHQLFSPVAASLGVTCAALCGTLPIQLAVFQGLPLLGPLCNLLLVFPCTLMLYAAFAGGFLGLLPLGLDAPFLFPAGLLARGVSGLAEQLARIPFSYWDLREPEALLGAALFLTAGLAAWTAARHKKLLCAVLSAAICLLGCGPALDRDHTLTLASISGSACVTAFRDGKAAVFVLGDFQPDAVRELLARKHVVRIESLCLPVLTRETREAAAELTRTCAVERLFLPGNVLLGDALAWACRKSQRENLEDKKSFEALEGLTVAVSHRLERLTFSAGGTSVALETGGTGEGRCGVLFTTQADSQIHSSFAILQNDAIIESGNSGLEPELKEILRPGCWALAGETGLFVELLPGGGIRLRGDSLCPSLQGAT